MLRSSLTGHINWHVQELKGCLALQIFSKQQMLPLELSSCCPCYVFSQQFAYLFLVKRVKCLPFLFSPPKQLNLVPRSQPCPQVFSVNDSITCNFAALLMFLISSMSQNSSKFGQQQLVMMNYECAFSQSEKEKYFE